MTIFISRSLMSFSTTIFIFVPPFFAIKKHLVFS
nr:MAG TPA: hypothetical protein [Siphoviridae sp. ct8IY7]